MLAVLEFLDGRNFKNNFSFGWQRWKLFYNFWSVRWLVRIANVLTPVGWFSSL